MEKRKFEELFKEREGVFLQDDVVFFIKKFELLDLKKGTIVRFKNIDDFYKYDNNKYEKIIKKKKRFPEMHLDSGRGASIYHS